MKIKCDLATAMILIGLSTLMILGVMMHTHPHFFNQSSPREQYVETFSEMPRETRECVEYSTTEGMRFFSGSRELGIVYDCIKYKNI